MKIVIRRNMKHDTRFLVEVPILPEPDISWAPTLYTFPDSSSFTSMLEEPEAKPKPININ